MGFTLVLPLRIAQFVFALISMGLSAYGMNTLLAWVMEETALHGVEDRISRKKP